MNKNLTIETYSHINSTLETLRNAIMYINHDETVEVLMKHHDAMQRMIDGAPMPRYSNQNGMTGFDPPPLLRE